MLLSREADICRLLSPNCFAFYKKSGGKDQSLKRTAAEMEASCGTDEGQSDVFTENNQVIPQRFLGSLFFL